MKFPSPTGISADIRDVATANPKEHLVCAKALK